MLQILYVEVRISWSISESPLEFEITRVDYNSEETFFFLHDKILVSCIYL